MQFGTLHVPVKQGVKHKLTSTNRFISEVHPTITSDKPVASPAAHGLLNGTAKRSMGAHSYLPQPNNPALSNAPPATQPLPGKPLSRCRV